MMEFTLLFRMNFTSGTQPGPEQMKAYMENWMNWINWIAGRGKLANGGNSFFPDIGRIVTSKDSITEGIVVEHGQSLAGYIVICVKDIEEATEIAKECPILMGRKTSVEIRQNNTTQEMRNA